jgi:hypothetical protein
LLSRAHQQLDADRVIAFFEAFKGKKVERRGRLERSVAPNTSRSNSEPTQQQTVSMADYKKFANDVVRGYYRNKPDEQKRLEQMFENAQREGRITA